MFIGHYGPAAAVAGERIKLWHGFVAVQFLDLLWAPFVLVGIEKLRIVENFTASNHVDLYFMPYSHSLVMALVWSVVAGGAYWLLRRSAGLIGGAIIAVLVFSHWIFDFLTHLPDLELWIGGPKVGLGLWENRPLSVGTEFALLIAGMTLYLLRTKPKGAAGIFAPAILLVALTATQIYIYFGPPPGTPAEAAQSAIVAFVVFALLAGANDATRTQK